MDEAYFEYVSHPEYPNAVDYVRTGAPVVAARTFSKAYGLAGMRIGYFISREDIIRQVERVRPPFNVTRLSQAAGVAALSDRDHLAMVTEANREAISFLQQSFEQMGLSYIPSVANFVMVDTGKDSRELFDQLLKQGIITRTGDIFGMLNWLRVSTGKPEQNARFIDNLRQILL
jgi:histidinol-phosphate aminotransferase